MGRVTDAHVSIPASVMVMTAVLSTLYFYAVMATGITPPPLQCHAASLSQMVFEPVSGVDLFRFLDLISLARRDHFHRRRLEMTVWLRYLSSFLPRSGGECLHDAMLIARITLCQFDKTAATANIQPGLVKESS